MTHDCRMGWAHAIDHLPVDPRRSYATPAAARFSEDEQKKRRLLDVQPKQEQVIQAQASKEPIQLVDGKIYLIRRHDDGALYYRKWRDGMWMAGYEKWESANATINALRNHVTVTVLKEAGEGSPHTRDIAE